MKKHAASAFSLIEVVVALGLFSFCIVGILALFAVAMGSARSVGDESNAVHVASSIAGIWEVAPATETVPLADKSTAQTVSPDALVDMGIFTIGEARQVLYYNSEGKINNRNGLTNVAAGATLKLEYDAAALPNNPNAYAVNMTFSWPANAPEGSDFLNQRSYQYIFVK